MRFEEELQAAVDDGVSVDLVVTPATDAPAPAEFDYLAVATSARARRGITTPVIAVADGNYSIYATQDALRDDQDRYGVIFNRSALGFLVSGFFGTVLWTTAEETLGEDESARSYPRRYASIRRCVKDLLDEGGEFYATIDGRDVEIGGSRVVRGKVREVSFEVSGRSRTSPSRARMARRSPSAVASPPSRTSRPTRSTSAATSPDHRRVIGTAVPTRGAPVQGSRVRGANG